MIPSSNLVFWVDFEELIHKSKDVRFVDLSPLPPKVPMCLKTKPTLGEIQGKNRKWMESMIAYSMVVSSVYLFPLIYVYVYSYVWYVYYIYPPNSTQLPRYTDVAFERLRASSEGHIDFPLRGQKTPAISVSNRTLREKILYTQNPWSVSNEIYPWITNDTL